jgi:predicted metal-binding membrane protein
MRLAGAAWGATGGVWSRRRRLRARSWALRRRPALLGEVLLLSAWVGALAMFGGEALARSGRAGASQWWCSPEAMLGMGSAAGTNAGRSAASAIVAGLPMWALMACAMMLPAALPAVRHVAVNSLRWRRGRAVAGFLLVYLAIWIAYGVLVLGALALLSIPSSRLLILALAVAAAWQLTKPKLRALRACHRSSPLPPRGWRAHLGVARFAARNGGACLGSCWALMLVSAVATSGRLLWMLALTALVCVEKLANRPLRATRHTAVLLGGGALGAGVVAALA